MDTSTTSAIISIIRAIHWNPSVGRSTRKVSADKAVCCLILPPPLRCVRELPGYDKSLEWYRGVTWTDRDRVAINRRWWSRAIEWLDPRIALSVWGYIHSFHISWLFQSPEWHPRWSIKYQDCGRAEAARDSPVPEVRVSICRWDRAFGPGLYVLPSAIARSAGGGCGTGQSQR